MNDPAEGRMPGVVMAKVAFAIVGIAAFGAGIRYDSAAIRWAGIGLVAVAWVLRLLKRPDQLPDDTR